MCRILGIEFYDGSHYLIKVPRLAVATNHIGLVITSVANVIIDLDERRFLKSRFVTDISREVSQHEIDWFMRGSIQYVQLGELSDIVKNLHRNR